MIQNKSKHQLSKMEKNESKQKVGQPQNWRVTHQRFRSRGGGGGGHAMPKRTR